MTSHENSSQAFSATHMEPEAKILNVEEFTSKLPG
jgi:hypothetical protein